MKENVIKNKSFAFALEIIILSQYLHNEKKEFVLSKQILRSGTAIGALIREAEQAESKADFVHKMAIAQKEANETDYWADLLFQSNLIDENSYSIISSAIKEINKILASIIITAKKKVYNKI